MKLFCDKNKFPYPTFVVVQTGTKVKEMKNVGSLDSPIRVIDQLPSEIQIPKMIEICEKNGINLDYYFLEFDTQDTEPEAYEMSDAWDAAAEEE